MRMGFFTTQLRQVLRRLNRTPMFTVVTLITLAVGVAANTVVFSVLEGILLKPLPYPQSQQLVVISESVQGLNIKELTGSPSNYLTFRDQNHSFQNVGLIDFGAQSASLTGSGEPEQVRTQRVTDGVISILGAAPILGRSFSRHDDLPGSPDTAVLMYGYWQSKFGGDRGVVGRSIQVDGKQRR